MKLNNKLQKGFTLIETFVVIGIIVLVMLSVTSFGKDIFFYNKYSQDSLTSAQDARIILSTMVRELRTAAQAENGSFAIAEASTSTITFFSDYDEDGLKDQIRYFVASTTLKKGIIKPTGNPPKYPSANETFSILANNIKNSTTSPLFEYYDSTYAGTSSPLTMPVLVNKIRLVRVNLTIDADPNRSPVPRTFSSIVNIRNLKDNL